MSFLTKNKKRINIIFVVGILLDLGIAFLINKISQNDFNILAGHNIVTCVVFCMLVIAYIICQILIKNGTTKVQKKRLQKAFQDNGGYEAVVGEMISCIEKHDYKSIRELKKIVDYIEK